MTDRQAADLAALADLATEAGLEVTATGRQASGRFIVECRPAEVPGRPSAQAGGA